MLSFRPRSPAPDQRKGAGSEEASPGGNAGLKRTETTLSLPPLQGREGEREGEASLPLARAGHEAGIEWAGQPPVNRRDTGRPRRAHQEQSP